MKNLKRLYEQAVNECIDAGIPISNRIQSVTVNRRAKRRWGRCIWNEYTNLYRIEISDRLLDESVEDRSTLNTLIHELIHTCPDCFNHGDLWNYYASIMNANYGYHVSRVTSAEELSVNEDETYYRYIIECKNCGHLYKYHRESRAVKLIRTYGENSGCECSVCKSRKLKLK